jgi:hypothetical protein
MIGAVEPPIHHALPLSVGLVVTRTSLALVAKIAAVVDRERTNRLGSLCSRPFKPCCQEFILGHLSKPTSAFEAPAYSEIKQRFPGRRPAIEIDLPLNRHSELGRGCAELRKQLPGLALTDLRFRVTVNTDNRLMSDVTMTSEFCALAETFGYGWADLQWFTVNAMKSAFIPFDERLALINGVIKPGFAQLKWAADR